MNATLSYGQLIKKSLDALLNHSLNRRFSSL